MMAHPVRNAALVRELETDFLRRNEFYLAGVMPGDPDFTLWLPNAPPPTPSALDDEFSDSAPDPKWTEFDPPTFLAINENEAGLNLVNTSPGLAVLGLYQSIPAGDFTMSIKVSLGGVAGPDYCKAGIVLWEDPTNENADLYTHALMYENYTHYVELYRYTDYKTPVTAVISTNVGGGFTSMYLRVRRTSTTYKFDFSSDGMCFVQLISTALIFTPTAFGVGCDPGDSGNTIYAMFSHFRYDDSDVGYGGAIYGDRCNFWRM